MRSCSALRLAQQRRALALRQVRVARERVEVRAQPGQRGAQLVAGVGREAAGGGHRGLQPREHPVERAGERADLVRALVGQRRREVLGARHARGARLQARERAHGERAEEPGGEAGQREREQADQQDEAADARHALVDRRERRERLEAGVAGAAERGSSATATSGPRSRRSRSPRARAGPARRPGRRPRARRPRRRRRPARTSPSRRSSGSPRARAAAEAARPGRPAQHLGRLLAQLLVDGPAAVALDRGEQQRARDRSAERDRQQRGEREPRPQAARRPHGRSAQPTPRTVCSVRGSPPASSLRRT